MFLAAVGRLRRDTNANRNFHGKIGVDRHLPVHQAGGGAAQRNSRDRAAGTMETRMVEVYKKVYKEKVLNDVFPDIKCMWPGGPGRHQRPAGRCSCAQRRRRPGLCGRRDCRWMKYHAPEFSRPTVKDGGVFFLVDVFFFRFSCSPFISSCCFSSLRFWSESSPNQRWS